MKVERRSTAAQVCCSLRDLNGVDRGMPLTKTRIEITMPTIRVISSVRHSWSIYKYKTRINIHRNKSQPTGSDIFKSTCSTCVRQDHRVWIVANLVKTVLLSCWHIWIWVLLNLPCVQMCITKHYLTYNFLPAIFFYTKTVIRFPTYCYTHTIWYSSLCCYIMYSWSYDRADI